MLSIFATELTLWDCSWMRPGWDPTPHPIQALGLSPSGWNDQLGPGGAGFGLSCPWLFHCIILPHSPANDWMTTGTMSISFGNCRVRIYLQLWKSNTDIRSSSSTVLSPKCRLSALKAHTHTSYTHTHFVTSAQRLFVDSKLYQLYIKCCL